VTPPALLFAAAALLPAMTSPSEGAPQFAGSAALIVALCSGGSMAVPLGGDAPQPVTSCCCAKGCRGGKKRKRIDRKQCR
jgi:hypothetical protein